MKKIYEDLIANVPDYTEFLTVEEMDASSMQLAKDYPDTVKLFEMGRTRENHPLYCLKIGCGSNNALMFGCPHPNEPIGTMMLEYFTRQLASNDKLREQLDYTWYIIKAWDADGTKLNNKWFKGPFTLYNYSRNFFRPAGHQQVDWTFPIDYKNLHFHSTIPESQAMMKLIDDIRPKFIYSLHNAGFGGVYWYMTREARQIYDAMRNAAKKQHVPLNLGEPEAPYCVAFDPAIYEGMGIEQHYDYLEEYGINNPEKAIACGTCSADYATRKCGAFTLLTELPYFYDRRIDDLSDSDITRQEAILKNLDYNQIADKFIRDTLDISKEYMADNNPFMLALESFSNTAETTAAMRKMVSERPEFRKPATEAEKFDNLLVSKFYKMLSFGMLVRANETELQSMKSKNETNEEKRSALKDAFNKAEKKLMELSDELENSIHYDVVPIKKLVAIQLECGLLMADYLQQESK